MEKINVAFTSRTRLLHSDLNNLLLTNKWHNGIEIVIYNLYICK